MTYAAVVFVLMLSTIFGGYWLFILRPEDQEDRALRRRMRSVRRPVAASAVIKDPDRLSTFGALESLLSGHRNVFAPLERQIAQSGKQITVGTLLLSCIFAALTVALLVDVLTGSTLMSLVGAAAAASLPILWIRYVARKRLQRFEELFPEAIDLLARALRAGHALPAALEMVGDEIEDPVGAEFKQLFDQQNYGMSLPDALRAFAARMPLLDARFFVTAVLTQRETGGNLSEVLDNLAHVIRERFKVKRQVRAISAHGRITGVVLGCLPPAVAALLMVIAPAHIRLLVDDPIGLNMVMVAVVLQIIGVLAIRRIIDVEY